MLPEQMVGMVDPIGAVVAGEDEAGEVEDDASGRDEAGYAAPEKPRHRQNFSWRQLAVLEQVFDQDPLPKLVCGAPRPTHLCAITHTVRVCVFEYRRRCGISSQRSCR